MMQRDRGFSFRLGRGPDRLVWGYLGVTAALIMGASARAQSKLSAELAPLSFIVGNWIGDEGHAEGGVAARGSFSIEPAVGGKALLRPDHTQLFASGRLRETIEQIMLVYPENGHLHGEYFDGTHVIHYTDVLGGPNGSASFVTATVPGRPAFRLTYARIAPTGISIRFEMRAPGAGDFHTIAEGTAHRAG